MSLLGLMVGMLLSVLSILATMTMTMILYRNMVDVAIDNRQAAQRNAQLAPAMQTTQLELLNADYGITDAKKSTDLAVNGTKKLLYWRFKDTPTLSTFTCCDVHYAPTSARATPMGFELTSIELTSCAALAASPWDPGQKLAMFTNDSGINCADVTITTTGDYFPYGRSTAAAHGMITITAQSAVAIETAGGVAMTSYTACLPNLHQLTIISS